MLEAIRDVYEETGQARRHEAGRRDPPRRSRRSSTSCSVHETLGADWLTPDLYRFGASSLLNDILMQIRKEKTGRYQSPDYFTVD